MSAPSDAPRILIANVNPTEAIRLEGMLLDAGHTQVRATTDLREVVGLYKKWDFDLLLITMNADTPEALKVIADIKTLDSSEGNGPTILALLESNSRQDQERALMAGARDFILCPLDRPEVIGRVRSLLETRATSSRANA